MTTHFSGPVVSDGGFQGDVEGDVEGNVQFPDPTTYAGADAASKAILPSESAARLTKATAGTDYTLAAPGADNVGKIMTIVTDTAAAHVVTVTGLLGGTTMTFDAAIGNSFTIRALSATVWSVITKNGVTQTA